MPSEDADELRVDVSLIHSSPPQEDAGSEGMQNVELSVPIGESPTHYDENDDDHHHYPALAQSAYFENASQRQFTTNRSDSRPLNRAITVSDGRGGQQKFSVEYDIITQSESSNSVDELSDSMTEHQHERTFDKAHDGALVTTPHAHLKKRKRPTKMRNARRGRNHLTLSTSLHGMHALGIEDFTASADSSYKSNHTQSSVQKVFIQGDDVSTDHIHVSPSKTSFEQLTHQKYSTKLMRFSVEDYLLDMNRDFNEDGCLEKLLHENTNHTQQLVSSIATHSHEGSLSDNDDNHPTEEDEQLNMQPLKYTKDDVDVRPPLGSSVDSATRPPITPFAPDSARKFPRLPIETLYMTHFEKLLALKYNNKAFFIFSNQNPVRKFFIWVTSNIFFTGGILLLIALNCVFLGMYDPLDSENETLRNKIVAVSEYVFTTTFAMEMFMKMFSMGLALHQNSYFRDVWNILDFSIVFLGLFSILLDVLPQEGNNLEFASSLNTLRTIRILRPLRAISTIPALRVLVSSLVSSAALLFNGLFLFVFFLWIFSIIGLQLFGGALRQYCFHDVSGEIWRTDRLCSTDWTFLGGQSCPDMYSCKENPNGSLLFTGVTNFENIFQSMLLVLQTSTLEGWTIIYNACVESSGFLYSMFIFFVIFFCGIFIINMLISVISDSFNISSQNEEKENSASQKGDSSSTWNNLVSRFNFYYDKVFPTPKWYQDSQLFVKKYIVQTVVFRSAINALIILNTVALAMEHHNQPDQMTEALTIVNYVFNSLFTMEIALKFFAFGLRDFMLDAFNLLDFLIVLFSWVENIASIIPGFYKTGALSALRIVRLVKIVRLFNSLSGLRKIVNALSRSLTSALMIIALLMLYILIFSLLGMQLYGGKLPKEADGSTPRTNFDSLWDAALTVFQVISGENWYMILYQVMALHWINVLYVVVLYVGGYYIILGLFAAVLIRNIAQERSEEDTQVIEQAQKDEEEDADEKTTASRNTSHTGKMLKDDDSDLQQDLPENTKAKLTQIDENSPKYQSVGNIQKPVGIEVTPPSQFDDANVNAFENVSLDLQPPIAVATEKSTDHSPLQRMKDCMFRNPFKSDVALFVFPQNRLRRLVARFVENILFELFIVFCILTSSLSLAFENPFTPPDQPIVRILEALSWTFNIIFYIEALLKIFAYGFVMHRTSYLRRSWWNCLDFFIVALSIFNTFSGADTFKALRSLRTMRSLRALRAARGLRLLKLKAINRVVYTVLYSFKSIFFIMMVSLLFFMIFGIMGVSLYGGKFYSCSNSSIVTRSACVDAGFTWQSPPQNFDNIGNALLTLFEMSTLEGWVQVKNLCVDAVSYDHAPILGNSPIHALYAVVFMVFANFIIVNLFVGVLIDKYALQKATDKRPDMNEEQSQWYDVQTLLTQATMESKPPKPKNVIQLVLYHICTTPIFEITIVVLTLLNAVSMSLSYYGNSRDWSFALEICNYVFNGIFTLELLIKMIAFGVFGFFKDPWNSFDFVIQALSLFGIFMQQVLNVTLATSIFRTFRVARLFKILKSARGIRALVTTLVMSIPSILNVLGLIFVLIFVYSILGVSLFARAYVEGEGVSYHTNFNTLGNAFITLIRIMTGEQWQTIMRGYMLSPPDCSRKIGNCGDHPLIAVAFFCSYVVFSMFIMMNLFVAIILENYSDVLSQERSNGVSAKDIDMFKTVWNEYDATTSGFIHVVSIPKFLQDVGAPLGVAPGTSMRETLRKIHGLRLYTRYGQVSFFTTLFALAEYEFGRVADDLRRDEPDALPLLLPQEKSVRKLHARLNKKFNKKKEKGEVRYPSVVGKLREKDAPKEQWVHISKYYTPVRDAHLLELRVVGGMDFELVDEDDRQSEAHSQTLSEAQMSYDSSQDDDAPIKGSQTLSLQRVDTWRRRFMHLSWHLLVQCLPFLKKTTEERYVTPTFGLTMLSWLTLVKQQQQRRNDRMKDFYDVVNTQPNEVTSYI
eukprot:CAMPEP_0117439288 /NCGR_PEP_ID=MMETSP0759-20121206/2489_1 /TAXON_ID=63605 /ORGANISM="Percolomonas cosmopolitus, Strain WS" /LENGTH=1964 /DNA_ID=CAMNT_0005231001 /DNA_START=239 /DNA_END=6133 /DNA_ORIENTATION=+